MTFYFYLTIQIFLFFLTPFLLTILLKKYFSKFKKYLIFFYVLWLFFYAYLTYIPFIFWYLKNDINVQSFLSFYGLIFVVIALFLMPLIYLIFILNVKFRGLLIKLINFVSILLLLSLTVVIFGIKIYNHKNVLNLNEICYQKHNSSKEKLTCCLKAEYVWNEGFSFFDKVPLNCSKYMNWND
jgi:hypothetical protein